MFVVAAAELNRLTLYLSPFVLVVLLGYSYMKRVTRWSHLVLGLALGLAPSAAWIAVRGSLDPRIWCSPRRSRCGPADSTCSTPARTSSTTAQPGCTACPRRSESPPPFGRPASMHLAMLGLLVWFGLLFSFGVAGWLGVAAVGLLLAYEHSLVSPRDLRRLNAAFFTMNGVIAMVFLAFVAADVWLRR